ncbi:hypothetical protein Mpsy_2116 [Methanolobus psychrophilus R15]|nr:hypothetical protein Mpsy_2116 [Methanolobus psychrophilus R15]
MKKVIILLVLIAALAAAGCTEEQQTPQNDLSLAENVETVQQDSDGGIQAVQVIGPVNYRAETYWQWHDQTTEILESKKGKNVKIYASGVEHKGKLTEVNGFYVVLHDNTGGGIRDNIVGEMYVSIDSISAIVEVPSVVM